MHLGAPGCLDRNVFAPKIHTQVEIRYESPGKIADCAIPSKTLNTIICCHVVIAAVDCKNGQSTDSWWRNRITKNSLP